MATTVQRRRKSITEIGFLKARREEFSTKETHFSDKIATVLKIENFVVHGVEISETSSSTFVTKI